MMKKTAFFLTTLILLGQLLLAQSYDSVVSKTDTHESNNVTLIGRWSNVACEACFVLGDYAYVAGSDSGMRIIDVSDPTSPREAGFYYLGARICDLYVTYNYAYVTFNNITLNKMDSCGLRIIDVSDPTSPVAVGYFDTSKSGGAGGVYVTDNYAYVVSFGMCWGGFFIIDVSDHTSPKESSYLNTNGMRLHVSGNYAYVVSVPTGGMSRLAIIDISDPGSPIKIGDYWAIGGGRSSLGVYVSGIYAYIADFEYGLSIIDVGDPTSPSEVSFFDTPGSAWGICVSGNYAYVADDSEGLRVIDVSDPTSPNEVGFFDTRDRAVDVYVSDKYIYVADCDSGLYILKMLPTSVHDKDTSAPTQYHLSQNYPNPFNPKTEISFSLSNADHVQLTIYNTLGKRVRNLVDKTVPAGKHSVQWDSRDDVGNPVPSGVYFYTIKAGEFSKMLKMTLLR